MANNGKVTMLKFSLTSNNDNTNITSANFNFSGDIDINQTEILVNNFKNIITGLNHNEMKTETVEESIPISLTGINSIPINEPVNETVDENEDTENEDNDISSMVYPIRGTTIFLNNVEIYTSFILKAWNTYSSVVVKSSNVRYIYGQELTYYRVVFPDVKENTFPLAVEGNLDLNSLYWQHSYPVCSCPAYYFKSYKKMINNQLVVGLCKHIDILLSISNIDVSKFSWNSRPDNLPLLLKNEGLYDYEWIPQDVEEILPNVQPTFNE
jgi:hypothetical protein